LLSTLGYSTTLHCSSLHFMAYTQARNEGKTSMSKLVPPHGADELMPRLLPEAKRAERLKHAHGLIQVPMTSRETSDFLMLAMGAYTPLTGFMGHDDWRGCCVDMK